MTDHDPVLAAALELGRAARRFHAAVRWTAAHTDPGDVADAVGIALTAERRASRARHALAAHAVDGAEGVVYRTEHRRREWTTAVPKHRP